MSERVSDPYLHLAAATIQRALHDVGVGGHVGEDAEDFLRRRMRKPELFWGSDAAEKVPSAVVDKAVEVARVRPVSDLQRAQAEDRGMYQVRKARALRRAPDEDEDDEEQAEAS